ncbi:helix-turn-helix transcriptional regulator [Pseudomonas sp. MS19]|uniref:helix-turn-helix domain-containing protein n=1 Tax=Pseudomonas sp. MS19 TaxID=2579939 RepID=UPI001562D0A2|nr:helix-turn-helix transcriptional regulator [Pseudomonas sp. MS19]NRH26449.1 helix-turn-helix transcriptional regulator [Pseudomonas sp. MS19]
MNKSSDLENFSINLKFLCGFYSSISEVCRKLSINRQQFNRYLSGESMPSYKNLKKICDFFGVESEEIVLSSKIFQAKVEPQNRMAGTQPVPEKLANTIMPILRKSADLLERYEGYYYRYFYSFGFPGYIFRSFVRIYKDNGVYYFKHIERTSGKNPMLGGRLTIKYHGLAFFLAERLYLIESETALNSGVGEAILTPSYRPNNKYLSGIMVCASTCSAHQPGAARTVLEYLGTHINVREAMRKCDLFHHTDERIPRNIKQAIVNTVSPEEFTLYPPRS